MAWLNPAITDQEIRQRFPEMEVNDCDAAIITLAISDAESRLHPRFAMVWNDDAALAADTAVKEIVLTLACAFIYRSSWGQATFTNTAESAWGMLKADAYEALEALIKGGALSAATRSGRGIRSTALDTEPVFNMGREEDQVEPGADVEAPSGSPLRRE